MEFWYKPMEELGGDFFDLIVRREEDGMGFFISDVAGHGVPSALITTMIKGLLNTQRMYLDRPRQLIQRINAALFENNVSDFFVTAFYLYLNLKEKPPLPRRGITGLYTENGRKKCSVKTRSTAFCRKLRRRVSVQPATALCFTDGITEC